MVKVQKTGLPYFVFSEEEQTGATFGERYTNAIERVYEKGFDTIITIGNDTPNLQTRQLLETAELLKQHKSVVGPSKDGGFYLLGMHKSQFDKAIFLALPWQTSRLCQIITAQLEQHTTVCRLNVLQDIDSIRDVQQLKDAFSISKAVREVLLQIMNTTFGITSLVAKVLVHPHTKDHYNKGSPMAA